MLFFYQVIAYALAIPSSKACCLIYPSDEEIDKHSLTLQDFSNQQKDIKLDPFRTNLLWNEQWKFDVYIQKVKQQFQKRLYGVIAKI